MFSEWINLIEETDQHIIDGFTNGMKEKFEKHMSRKSGSPNFLAIIHSKWWINRAMHNKRVWYA